MMELLRKHHPPLHIASGCKDTSIACLVICLAIFAAYGNTFRSPFIFDDFNAIVDNPNIRSLLPLSRALSAPDQSTVAGRPVAGFSLAVNYAVSRLDPWSYHLVNILLHCAAACLLFGILKEMLKGSSGRGRGSSRDETAKRRNDERATGRSSMVNRRGGVSPPFMRHNDPRCPDAGVNLVFTDPVSRDNGNRSVLTEKQSNPLGLLLITLIWALHPLHTEAVTYVSTRTELLIGVFSLAAVRCLIRCAASTRPVRWGIAGIFASALAMGSKESAVVLPVILVLFDRVFIAQSWRNLLARRGVFHLAATATWLILIALVTQGARSETAGFHLTDISPLDYLRTQAGVIPHYLRLAVFPHPLVLDYFDWPVARTWTPANAIILSILLGLTAISIVKAIQGSKTGFFGAWFLLTLAPASSIVPIVSEIAAERRMYLPLIAVVILSAHVCSLLPLRFLPAGSRWLGRSAALTICLLLGIMTWQRNGAYTSELSIWQNTVARRPGNSRAHANLGTEYLRAGDLKQAIYHFQTALNLDPEAASLNLRNIASASDEHPFPAQNLSDPCPSLQVSSIKSIENLGLLYLEQGDPGRALVYLQLVSRCHPDDAVTHINLANAAIQSGDAPLARTALADAVQLDPENVTAHIRLSQLLAETGEPAAAMIRARQAAALAPGDPVTVKTAASVHVAAGRMLVDQGRDGDAKNAFEYALVLQPGYGDAGNSLAVLLAQSTDPAVRDPARALKLAEALSAAAGHRNPVLLGTLATALEASGRHSEAQSIRDRIAVPAEGAAL